MKGLGGNDTYYVDDAADQVIEAAGGGTDRVLALVDYTLRAGAEVETLSTTSTAGTTAIDLVGNSFANAVLGNAGINILDGGDGADVLTGYAGNDTFVFRAGQADGDRITDFAGNGAAAGDDLRFIGFGTAVQGATFTRIDATHWQIHSGLDHHNETVTLLNGAAVHASEAIFI
jgi:Ca2+-binding RTX toxin-like protein